MINCYYPDIKYSDEEIEKFFQIICCDSYKNNGSDGRIGRKLYSILKAEYKELEISFEIINITSENVDRNVLAELMGKWKLYFTCITQSEINSADFFDEVITSCRREDGFFVWSIPIITVIKNVNNKL